MTFNKKYYIISIKITSYLERSIIMAAFRNTIQKDAVLKVFFDKRTHMTAEQVLEYVQAENPVISRSTVFRILNQLSERGSILRIRVPDGADYFDFNTVPHYHVKCVECGSVFDIDMPFMDDLTDHITNNNGFVFLDHYILFTGICPDCASKTI